MDAPAIASSLPPAQIQKAWKAAQDFEAMTLNQFLTPMFDTIDTSKGPFGGGQGEEAWKPMMIDTMAKNLEKAGGLGLAAPVFRQMIHMQETAQEQKS
jgi:Rod binding domain-containing protein